MIPHATPVLRRSVEWPTVLLTLVIYGGWLAVTWFWRSLPGPLLVGIGAWLLAWQGSLQHEVMHGHPTRIRALNDAIGWPPLTLWLPYAIYRTSHLRHHRDELLTDPIEDPESVYLEGRTWDALSPVPRLLLTLNMTLAGRLLIGPAIMIGAFLRAEARLLRRGAPGRAALWAWHALGCAAVLGWVVIVCGMPAWLYLAGFLYAGAALTRLRSFAEHRYADRHEERTAIVERGGLLGLLYLNNNLHVLHHLRPALAWYQLPKLYARDRVALRSRNGGLVYDGYGDVIRRFLFRIHDRPRHPGRVTS